MRAVARANWRGNYSGACGNARAFTSSRSPFFPLSPAVTSPALERSRFAALQLDPAGNARFLSAIQRLMSTTPGDGKETPQPDSAKSAAEASTGNTDKSSAADSSKENADRKAAGADSEKEGKSSGQEEQKGPESDPNNPNWMGQAALAMFVMLGLSVLGGRDNGKEISFQAFVWDLLEPGLVERIEVVNKTTARVYLKPSAQTSFRTTDLLSRPSREDMPTASDNRAADTDSNDRGFRPDPAEFPEFEKTRPENSPPSRRPRPGESRFYFNIGTVDTFERKLESVQEDLGLEPEDFVGVTYVQESNITSELLRHLPTIVLLGMGMFMMRNAFGSIGGMSGGRGGIFQVGKANPIVTKAGEKGAAGITFAEVAGLNEAKTEVMEFVDFLKNPGRYEKLGAKIPKGALLVGPPGTGKTLLAKATAGEASVPFFSMSGSDFIEMFVGVGPSRVRDLFAQARANAPCIVFIDEIDAVGRARGRGGMAGGNDERENTLNALLVEMDGFTSSTGVVVLAGTNRADILDRALLRPGRFDRQINIDKPDMRGRYDIFMVHLAPLKVKADTASIAKRLAALTPGFAGADIANICNEAALIAARSDKDAVELSDFEKATDRVIGGLEKKNKVISRKEREIVAHHEAGHAVAGWFLQHADPLIKVSIIPRGSAALGFAQYLPVDKFLQSTDQIRDFMIMALGGRVAEQLCFDSITTGAQDDLRRVTSAVYRQITNFGMSDVVGKVYFPKGGESGNQFYKPYSEKTAELIDEEALRIVDEAYEACEKLLAGKLDTVKALAARLLEKEVLGEEDLVEILGPRPFSKPVDYDTFVGRFDKDRKDRTGQSSEDDNPFANDGAHTPPIPTAEGSEEGKSPGRWAGPSSGRGGGTPETIPELA